MAEGSARVLIVGGGLTGLVAATTLRNAGVDSLVLERDPDIGGRMSTRRIQGAVFDDGAQFFTVKDPRFAPFVNAWIEAGVVTDWFHSHLIRGGASNPDGHPRYCGVDGMRGILHHLRDQGVAVRTGAEVEGFAPHGNGYTVTLTGGETLDADAVLLAHPVPYAVELAGRAGLSLEDDDRDALSLVSYIPSLSVLARMDKPTALTEWGGLRINGEWIDWIGDNQRKGISPEPAVTLQAMPRFSSEHWDDDDDDIADRLIDNAHKLLGCDPVSAEVVRWELGKPISTHPKEWIALKDHPRVILSGDGFKGYRVEGAATSGFAAANALIERLKA